MSICYPRSDRNAGSIKEIERMSYDAKVFNVMVASPGDVLAERAVFREVIHEWNAANSEVRKVVLLPVGWEP